MHPDLQHLIQLQDLDLSVDGIHRRIAEMPSAQDALERRLSDRTAAVAAIKDRISASQAARREIEKELAFVQGRLSKFKDQLMEVKTNKEYQAMQHEIATAEQSVRSQEDRLLDRMEEAEVLAAELKTAEAALRVEQAEIAREKQQLAAERVTLESEAAGMTSTRSAIVAQLSPQAIRLFDYVAKHRKGLALSEAREGHCTQCHVRLRPQVFNEVRRNESLIQCESCLRILYFSPTPAPNAGTSQAS